MDHGDPPRRSSSSRNNIPTSSTSRGPDSPAPDRRFRTVTCKHWMKRDCRKGDDCTYRHPDYSSYASATAANTAPVPSHSGGNTRPGASSARHSEPSPPTRTCEHYFTRGTCKFGDSCKFSHEALPTLSGSSGAQIDVEDTVRQLSNLKGIMRSFHNSKQFNSFGRFEEFLDITIGILDGNNRNVRSEAVVLLSENDSVGCEIVRYIATDVGKQTPFTRDLRELDFDRHLVPFMKIIVHDVFTSSCVEKNLLYLVKALYGPTGERAARFLDRVVAMLEGKAALIDGDDTKLRAQDDCHLLCRIFYNIVVLNSDAMAQEELQAIHARLLAFSNQVRSLRSPISGRIERLLSQTASHLFPSSARAVDERRGALASVSGPSIQFSLLDRLMDLPGKLSPSRERHDNDSDVISEIRILPTKGEVNAQRLPYLPYNDNAAPHFLEGPGRLFDIHFRLLREDMVGQLRSSVSVILSKLPPSAPISAVLSQYGDKRDRAMASIRFYFRVTVESAVFDKRQGLQFRLRFQQHPKLKSLSKSDRVKCWAAMRSLEWGSLLCLVSNEPEFKCFLTVANKDEEHLGQDPNWSWIDVVVADGKDSAQEYLLRLVAEKKPKTDSLLLMEFSGVLLPAYQTILENLQTRSTHPYLPFSHLLCPRADERKPYVPRGRTLAVQPPLYALAEDIQYDLAPLKKDQTSIAPLLLPRDASPDDDSLVALLEQETTLDGGQCRSLIAGLTQELVMIQGPPGTGKTYLGVELVKALLHNKLALDLNPIICVCYTNHALDQFLEHLLPVTKNIVRIGSKSKSTTLEEYNLKNLVRKNLDMLKFGHERATEGEVHNEIRFKTDYGTELCEMLRDGHIKMKWKQMSTFLRKEFPFIYSQLLSETDHNGFVMVGAKDGNYFEYWVRGEDIRFKKALERYGDSRHENLESRSPRKLDSLLLPTASIWDFSKAERRLLLNHWEQALQQRWIDTAVEQAQGHQKDVEKLNTLSSEYQRRVLAKADVIGITTTGLAQKASLLQRVNSKTLICEEAGEVLESHLLTALLSSIEHCILIGDHMQLRPQIANHDLSVENSRQVKHNLDVSLFERLCISGVPSTSEDRFEFPLSKLTVQRRMRPEIADLVRLPLYNALQDHNDVQNYPPVAGMHQALFWFDHQQHEDRGNLIDSKDTSHSNMYEVHIVTQLVSHLSKQGCYKSGDIAVITPYVGQLRKLRDSLRNTFSVQMSETDADELSQLDPVDNVQEIVGRVERKQLTETVRIATVDNFQGEEAKVIIVSLVRSNENGNVGFLKTPNRINVLLSRAQHGMYIIGDSKCAQKVKMWEEVIGILQSRDQIGATLRLRCTRHKDIVLNVVKPEDFEVVAPEGGCKELCGRRLDCGHSCDLLCHAEIRHRVAPCRKACERGRPDCGHSCPKPCSEPCGKCIVQMKDIPLPCGHRLASVPCWVSRDLTKPEGRCKTRVVRKLPRCGHEVEMPCCLDPDKFPCQKKCGGLLSCKHQLCTNICSACTVASPDGIDRPRHAKPCPQPCEKPFTTCSHRCRRECHASRDENCGTCEAPCELGCTHSKCRGKCGQFCVPCAEPCTWVCEHRGQCKMPCGAPCDRLPCNQRCSLMLPCGHQCPSICGELCPDSKFCQICGSANLKERVVDFIEYATYETIDLDHDPIIVLPCQHFYITSFLDELLDLNTAYVRDENDQFIQGVSFEGLTFEIKRCPECNIHISGIQRYNRVLKRAILDIMLKSLIIQSQWRYNFVSQALDEFELEVDKSRDKFVRSLQPRGISRRQQPISGLNAQVIAERMEEFESLTFKIEKYTNDVGESKQPHVRVYKMSIAARDRDVNASSPPTASCPLDVPYPDIKHPLLGNILELRLDAMRYEELLQLANRLWSLDGCKVDARPLYKDIIKKCTVLHTKAEKFRSQSEERQYHCLTVEIMLLHVQLTSLLLRASQIVAPTQTSSLREAGLETLSECEKYFQTYQSCRKYRPAAERAGEMLKSLSHFHQAISVEERRAILRAMSTELSGTGHWYRCRNGHPFSVGECGGPMQATTCPECGEPVGGEHHRPADGVTIARDFDELLRR